MIRKTPISRLVALVLSAGVTGAAHAGDGFYVGGGAGQASADEGPYDDQDTALSLFGGYQFNRWFALEGGYIDLGEIEPNRAGASLEADTFYVAAVGTIPVNDAFAVYGKVGVHRWNADTGLAVLGGDDSGTDATYGVGAQYRFNERFALRAELSRFELGDADVDVAQVQARFDF